MTAAAVQTRANSAAADAARDARAEELERLENIRVPGVSKAVSERATKDGYYHFITDIWITDFNFTEFGIYKRQRNRAKSRQFTSDMDIFAEVIEARDTANTNIQTRVFIGTSVMVVSLMLPA